MKHTAASEAHRLRDLAWVETHRPRRLSASQEIEELGRSAQRLRHFVKGADAEIIVAELATRLHEASQAVRDLERRVSEKGAARRHAA